jgi:dipeptidyl aminopeptidase/acylaminoacyl peptidase
MRLSHCCLIVCLVSMASAVPVADQSPKPAAPARLELTVDSIMRGPKLVGYPPSGLRWSGDSKELYFEWRRPGEDEASTYVIARDGDAVRKLTPEERRDAPPANGVWNEAYRRALFVEAGDILIHDGLRKTRLSVTRTTQQESNPRWARNETAVTFVGQNNLFLVPLATGSVQQLTDVRPRRRDARDTDSQKYVKDEEQKLIEFTRDAAERRKKAEAKRDKESLPEFEISEQQSIQDIVLHPDEVYALLAVAERASGAKPAIVPNYVTESSYPEDIPARTLAGDAQDKRRLAILNLKTHKTVWADASFAGTRKARPPVVPPAAAGAAPADKPADKPSDTPVPPPKDEPREVRWSTPLISKDGKLVVAVARAEDFKDRWIVALDPETGKTRVVDALHDDAWIRDIGGFGPGGGSGMGWMPDGHTLFFLSERDGWMHLYTVDVAAQGAKADQLTSGRFELSSAELSSDKKTFYLTSTEAHPGERHLYEMPIGGGARTKITTTAGAHAVEVSPDGLMLADLYSYTTAPPEVFLVAKSPGATPKRVTTSPTLEWSSFKWIDPQVITFKARDGAEVYARLFTPEMIGAKRDRSHPGVVFVHGAGYAQNAHKYWSTYYREYMFDNLLASKGYVVLDVDYRASAGYGRDWRTAIYRSMGDKDLGDIVDGAKYLVETQQVDPARVGLWGGSYGGFITLMAMFNASDTFAAGAALRPVTDWAHYNHGYTASILNQPQDDAQAYQRSSPIYFAEKLKGALLICHGLVDTNVFAQDSIRLVQRLIELRKTNWELAVYPVENHGFEQETSWADEYRRILSLFEGNLRLAPTRPAPRGK